MVQEIVAEETSEFISLKAEIIDESILYIRDSITMTKSKYSCHWQKFNDELIIRWDNSTHHPEISTFPYHLHDGNEIKASDRVFINDVLNEIARRLVNKT